VTIELLSNVGALLAAVAAMFTAVGTFLTVRQIRRQMEASYRPELTFARVFLTAEPDSPGCPLPTHWTEQPRYPATGTWAGTTTGATITTLTPVPGWFFTNLYNVGLGAATSINVVWNFALEDMIAEINRLAQRTLTPAFYEYKNGALSLESQTWPPTTIFWENEKTASLDYLMPESTHHAAAALKIPMTYIHLFSTYLYLLFLQKDTRVTMQPFPLQIKISYGDISGRRHQVSFSLRIHFISARAQKDLPRTFEAYIDAEKLPLTSRPLNH
jgi:hypothetical protein